MDALKYFLNIDPVGDGLRSSTDKQENRRQPEKKSREDTRKKKTNKYNQPTVAVQFQYISS